MEIKIGGQGATIELYCIKLSTAIKSKSIPKGFIDL